MISSLKGNISRIFGNYIEIEVNGVGYLVYFVGAHGNAPVQSGCGEISVGAHGNAPVQNLPVQNLGYIIRGIKMAVSTKLKIIGYQLQVWQRNYYEMIVRDESDYNRVVKYILNNPLKL